MRVTSQGERGLMLTPAGIARTFSFPWRRTSNLVSCLSFPGLCLERPGCECQPKKKRQVLVDVIVGTNSSSTSQLCSTVRVEEHRGPCRCKCALSACHYRKIFDEAACLCRCKAELAGEKRECAVDFEREWHEDSCTCECRPRICVSGQYQDQATCQCRPIETCAVLDASSSAVNRHHLSAVGDGRMPSPSSPQAPKYVGLACVVAVAFAMLLSLYYMVAKRRAAGGGGRGRGTPGGGSTGSSVPILAAARRSASGTHLANGGGGGGGVPVVVPGTETVVGTLQRATAGGNGRQTAAYTITINSASAANLDEAMMPLAEDKTRF